MPLGWLSVWVGLGDATSGFDAGQIGRPGVEVVNVYEGALPKFAGNQSVGADFFTKLGQTDASRLRRFVDTIRDAIFHDGPFRLSDALASKRGDRDRVWTGSVFTTLDREL